MIASVGDPLPRGPHVLDIDLFGQRAHELLDVDTDVRALEMVEQHPSCTG
jgi:hypothetical protein